MLSFPWFLLMFGNPVYDSKSQATFTFGEYISIDVPCDNYVNKSPRPHTFFFFFGEENFYSTTTQEDTKLWTLRYTYHVYRVSFNIDIYCPNYVFALIIHLNITYFAKNWKLKTIKKNNFRLLFINENTVYLLLIYCSYPMNSARETGKKKKITKH